MHSIFSDTGDWYLRLKKSWPDELSSDSLECEQTFEIQLLFEIQRQKTWKGYDSVN